MARRRRRPLCGARTADGGTCANYRDTCPVRAHKTSRPTEAFQDRAASPRLRPSGTAGAALADDPGLLARMCGEASQHYNLAPELIEHDYRLIATLFAWTQTVGGSRLPRPYLPPWRQDSAGRVVFAGGTSLSAVWNISPRWSADIDLILDPEPGLNDHKLRAACKYHAIRAAEQAAATCRDLAARCALGAGSKHKGRAERKRALTVECSSRWAGSITRRTDDVWERQMLNYRDELIDKRAAVAAIVERLARPVGESGGYKTQQERFAKQKRLQALRRRVGWLEGRIGSGRVSVVRGGKRLLSLRNNLEASDVDESQWRDKWDATRWFIAADGDSQYQWGNGLISVDADTGEVSVTLPAPLRHLANAPRGRFVLARPAAFSHRSAEWGAQAATAAVSYELTFDPDKGYWHLDASWRPAPIEVPSLHQLRSLHTLAVDLNADHLAAWAVTPDGNPMGDPITIAYDSNGSSGRNNASLRHAITTLLRIAAAINCRSISIENLNFRDARSVGREKMGRGKRGKKFRRTVASMPTAEFRDRLAAMTHNKGIAIIAVDPAYTTKWGREHWLAHLKTSRRTPCSGHHAAAAVIGRRALGLTAKRRSNARDGHHQHPTEDGAAATTPPQPVKGLQAAPTTPKRDAEEAREPVKRKTSQHGTSGTHRYPAERAETPTRHPAKHHGQGTANRSRRPPSRQRKPTATN